MRGKFIVFEGQGFTGKTTQAELLTSHLRSLGIEVIETHEPGGIKEAEEIREAILKRRADGLISSEEEVELFYKSRKLFLDKLVKPSLDKGIWVISTRFSVSTYIYQGLEGGVSLDLIDKLEKQIVDGFKPDLYILLDVSAEEIIKRLKANLRQKHSFNELDKEKIINRRKNYLKVAKENKDKNWVIVDGEGDVEEVEKRVLGVVSGEFKLPLEKS